MGRYVLEDCKLSIVAALVALGVTGCSRGDAGGVAPQTEPTPIADLEAEVGYDQATWRADPARLNSVRLSIAHVLIAHSRSIRHDPGSPFWAEPSQRTREEALRIAFDIARSVHDKPDRLAELARAHSDDRASRDAGGELGIVAVAGLPPALLDALSDLDVGQVSRVVESDFGFHVVRRLPVAKEQRVAARHIVVRHRDDAGEPQATRARDEAAALAKRLHGELKGHPERFAELARQYSDAPDAADGGYMGSISTHEGSQRAQALRLLSGREVGFVSEPFETGFGYEIYQRAEDDPRPDEPSIALQEERVETEMPKVEIPSLEERIGTLSATDLSRGTLRVLEVAEARLPLSPEQKNEFRALFKDLAARLETSEGAEQRQALIAEHRAKVLALIGPAKMATLHALREDMWRRAQMM